MASGYRARRKVRWKLRVEGRGREETRASGPFGGPSASERPVISFYIHPTRFEPLLFHFQPSYLSLTALTLCRGIARRNFLVIRDRKQSFARENDSSLSILLSFNVSKWHIERGSEDICRPLQKFNTGSAN